MRAPTCALAVIFLLAAACGDAGPRIVVVEEHHLAWPAWEEARAAGEIGVGAVLLHLDAHEDMGEPEVDIDPGVDPVEARRIALQELAVDEPIRPALATGTLSRVVWVPPPWLAKAAPSDPRVRVARLADLAPIEGEVILDVDLDFFACENPHASHLDAEIDRREYEELRRSGRVWMEGDATEGDETTHSIVLARPPGPFRWPVRIDRVRNERTGGERFVRGFLCMGEYRDAFPVHRPTDAGIDELAAAVGDALRRAEVRPKLVTIARSATSGFAPPARVERIQAAVLRTLR